MKQLMHETIAKKRPSCHIRPHLREDMAWIVQMHGRVFPAEFGWNEQLEALVADVTQGFIERADSRYECCWIAESEGRNIGSAMVVRVDDLTAKLRVVIVDPSARGAGVGRRLVEHCIFFARAAGYRRMTLWTDGHQKAAIRLYRKLGFKLVVEDRYFDYGKNLIAQTWHLELG